MEPMSTVPQGAAFGCALAALVFVNISVFLAVVAVATYVVKLIIT